MPFVAEITEINWQINLYALMILKLQEENKKKKLQEEWALCIFKFYFQNHSPLSYFSTKSKIMVNGVKRYHGTNYSTWMCNTSIYKFRQNNFRFEIFWRFETFVLIAIYGIIQRCLSQVEKRKEKT